jgi:fatty-acyl-CoA synthase
MVATTVLVAVLMTETSPVSFQSSIDDPIEARVSTVGSAHPHVEVKIIDPSTGLTLPRGQAGELCTRGYVVMRGYWNDSAATDAAIDSERWMHSGDLASMREDGRVSIVGRLKHLIIRGGENIYPREIEAVLASHPSVAEAVVVGVPDRFWGEVVGAVIRPAFDVAEAELAEHCRERLAAYKTPVRWLFTDAFPLTSTGKIRKDVLGVQLSEAALAETGLVSAPR